MSVLVRPAENVIIKDDLSAFAPTVEQYQRALAAEIATIELIDEAVGEVLAAVERRDNTIVILRATMATCSGIMASC